jgi:hypothetical protein
MDVIKVNTETLIGTSKEVGLDINIEEMLKYMLLSRHHNEGRNRDIKIAIHGKNCGFHGGNYEECPLLGCYAMRLL